MEDTKHMEGKTRRTKQDTTEQGSPPRWHRMLRTCKTAEDNARQFKRATAASRTQPAEPSRRHGEKKQEMQLKDMTRHHCYTLHDLKENGNRNENQPCLKPYTSLHIVSKTHMRPLQIRNANYTRDVWKHA